METSNHSARLEELDEKKALLDEKLKRLGIELDSRPESKNDLRVHDQPEPEADNSYAARLARADERQEQLKAKMKKLGIRVDPAPRVELDIGKLDQEVFLLSCLGDSCRWSDPSSRDSQSDDDDCSGEMMLGTIIYKNTF